MNLLGVWFRVREEKVNQKHTKLCLGSSVLKSFMYLKDTLNFLVVIVCLEPGCVVCLEPCIGADCC